MDDTTTAFLFAIVPRTPLLLVYVVGLVLALVYGRTLRTAAVFAGLGFGLLIAATLVGFASQYWIMTAARADLPAATIGTTVAAFGGVNTAVTLIGTVFLMIAIFYRRSTQSTEQQEHADAGDAR